MTAGGDEFAGLSITALRRRIGEIEEKLSLAMIRGDAISNPEIASRIKTLTATLEVANERLSRLRAEGRGKRPERRKGKPDAGADDDAG